MLTVAIGTPPAHVVAVLLFLVAGIVSAIRKDPVLGCISFGLAALAWPW